MGFNNIGVEEARERLRNISAERRRLPIGVNIGRSNDRKENVPEEYNMLARNVSEHASYLLVNVSCPNTPGLTKLQNKGELGEIIDATKEGNIFNRPIVIKLGPNLSWEQYDGIADLALEKEIAAVMATNTDPGRDELPQGTPHREEMGGLSGRPLTRRSSEVVRHIFRETDGELPIIGVGGIATWEDALQSICAGASLIQLYTGLVYEGPGAVKRINEGLVRYMEQEGVDNITDLVGVDAR